MNARRDLYAAVMAGGAHSPDRSERASELIDAFQAEVIREAIEAARSEYLTDDTGTDEDAAYNQGVTDAIAAISALVESGAS